MPEPLEYASPPPKREPAGWTWPKLILYLLAPILVIAAIAVLLLFLASLS